MDLVSQGIGSQDESGGIWLDQRAGAEKKAMWQPPSPEVLPILVTIPSAQKSLQSWPSLNCFCSDGICVWTDRFESSLLKITHAKVTKPCLSALTKMMPTVSNHVRSIEIKVPQKSLKLNIKPWNWETLLMHKQEGKWPQLFSSIRTKKSRSLCKCVYRCLQKPQDRVKSPGTRVTGSYEPPNPGARQVFYQLNHFPISRVLTSKQKEVWSWSRHPGILLFPNERYHPVSW